MAGVERATQLYLEGMTLAQVGAEGGVSVGTVRRPLIGSGVALRPPLQVSPGACRETSRG